MRQYELQGIVILGVMTMGCPILVGRSRESAATGLVKEHVNSYTFSLKDPSNAAKKHQNPLQQKPPRINE